MIITQRQKLPSSGRSYTRHSGRIPINFDLASLNLLCSFVLSENRNVRRIQYINLRNLMDMLDPDRYVNDQERYKRVLFIKKGLEARLEKNLQDTTMILKYINGGIIDNDMIDTSSFKEMSNAEIDWVNETISGAIKYSFIYERTDQMLDMWTRFSSADYKSISSIVSEIEANTAELNTLFRKAKVESTSERGFSLNPEIMESAITEAWLESTSSYRRLVTGMQGFNQLIGGGFENSRVYLLLGITGVGKSMTLINIAYQLKKYNKGYKCKDPTKRPCIVYLTFENTILETIQRLFQICTGEDFAKQTSPQEAINKLRGEGELYLTDESPIDIIIKFRPNRSEDTSYLYTLVEDLEDEGYETIALIQDHAKRIRSAGQNQDIRLELGDVINEFKTFAMLKDISVITNSHLNREGARVIDEKAGKSKADLTRLLGKSNIGESLLMLDNVDFAAIINTEYDNENHKYMVFKQIKTRIKTFRDYICQPFDTENDIKLVEDFYSIPVFKESLYTAPVLNTGAVAAANVAPNNSRYINNIESIDDDEDNIYQFSSRYTSTPKPPEPTNLVKPFTIKISA